MKAVGRARHGGGMGLVSGRSGDTQDHNLRTGLEQLVSIPGAWWGQPVATLALSVVSTTQVPLLSGSGAEPLLSTSPTSLSLPVHPHAHQWSGKGMSNTGTHMRLLPPHLSTPHHLSTPPAWNERPSQGYFLEANSTQCHLLPPYHRSLSPPTPFLPALQPPAPHLHPRLVTLPMAPPHHPAKPWEGLQDRTTAPGTASVTPEGCPELSPQLLR